MKLIDYIYVQGSKICSSDEFPVLCQSRYLKGATIESRKVTCRCQHQIEKYKYKKGILKLNCMIKRTWLEACLSSFEESCSICSPWCNTLHNREDVQNIIIRERRRFLVVKIVFFQRHLDAGFLAEFTEHADFLDTICFDEGVNVVTIVKKNVVKCCFFNFTYHSKLFTVRTS